MSITLKTRYVVILFIALLAGLFASGWWLGWSKAKNASDQVILSLNEEINRYKTTVHDDSLYVVEIKQEITKQREAIKKGEIEKAELKALHLKAVSEVTFLKGQIKILKDSIGHTGQLITVLPCDSVGEALPAIVLPFTFRDSTMYYDIMGGFNSEARMRLDITVPIALDVWLGLDKATKEYKAVVTTDNPVVNFTEIKSLKLDLKKPTKIGIGLQGGYGLSSDGKLRPYIGIGASYNIIRF